MEKIAFIFSGQGSQYVGMGETFYRDFEIVRQTYEEASDVSGYNIAELCFQGTVLEQNQIDKMQFIVVTTGVAIARAFSYKYGITPQFCAGHSVGEYAALVCSGAVKFSDAIKILKVRGELLKDALTSELGQMSIVEKISRTMAEEIISKNRELQGYISCYNSSDQFAISGSNLEPIEEEFLIENARVTPIINSPPIHCPLMDKYMKEFYDYLCRFMFYSFRIPVVSNVTGAPFSEPEKLPLIMSEQLIKPVQWVKTMMSFEKYGISMVVEMGPKNLLTAFFKDIDFEMKRYCFGVKSDREEIDKLFLSDASLQKDRVEFLGRCLGIAVSTQNLNDNVEEYQSGVTDNYNYIQSLVSKTKESDRSATVEEMHQALQCVIGIMQTKKVPENEQQDWLKQLLDETCTYYLLKDYVK